MGFLLLRDWQRGAISSNGGVRLLGRRGPLGYEASDEQTGCTVEGPSQSFDKQEGRPGNA
jgi:hypothetical protein